MVPQVLPEQRLPVARRVPVVLVPVQRELRAQAVLPPVQRVRRVRVVRPALRVVLPLVAQARVRVAVVAVVELRRT